jgi:hypothetical protein
MRHGSRIPEATRAIFCGACGSGGTGSFAPTRESYGRDHHPRCFSLWLAGGGIRPGLTWGATDDYSYNIIENPVSVHDLHATLLNRLGLNHEQLTYRYEGRYYRLTDVHGQVVHDICQG